MERDRMNRLPSLCQQLGIKRSTAYKWIKDGILPPPLKLGKRISVWPQSAIDRLIEDAKRRG